jgi:hypothetical protein
VLDKKRWGLTAALLTAFIPYVCDVCCNRDFATWTPKHQACKSGSNCPVQPESRPWWTAGRWSVQEVQFTPVRRDKVEQLGGPKLQSIWRGRAAAQSSIKQSLAGPCLAWHLRVKDKAARAFSQARSGNGQKSIPPRDRSIGSQNNTTSCTCCLWVAQSLDFDKLNSGYPPSAPFLRANREFRKESPICALPALP